MIAKTRPQLEAMTQNRVERPQKKKLSQLFQQSLRFRVFKSVHHHTLKQINQPDASVTQIFCSSFKYSTTCFGHPLAHHQELINCSSRLWIPQNRTDTEPTPLLPPRSNGKPEVATAVYKLLMMGKRMPETC